MHGPHRDYHSPRSFLYGRLILLWWRSWYIGWRSIFCPFGSSLSILRGKMKTKIINSIWFERKDIFFFKQRLGNGLRLIVEVSVSHSFLLLWLLSILYNLIGATSPYKYKYCVVDIFCRYSISIYFTDSITNLFVSRCFSQFFIERNIFCFVLFVVFF